MNARSIKFEPGRYTVFYEDGAISMPISGRHAKAVTLLYGGHYRPLAPDWLDRLQDRLPQVVRYGLHVVLPWLLVCVLAPVVGYYLPSIVFTLKGS
jgi:hypothetical protein